MLLWATKAQFSTGPNWASLSFFFLFVYFCLTAARPEKGGPVSLSAARSHSLRSPVRKRIIRDPDQNDRRQCHAPTDHMVKKPGVFIQKIRRIIIAEPGYHAERCADQDRDQRQQHARLPWHPDKLRPFPPLPPLQPPLYAGIQDDNKATTGASGCGQSDSTTTGAFNARPAPIARRITASRFFPSLVTK